MLAELPRSLPVLTGRALAWIDRRRAPTFAVAAMVAAAALAATFVMRSYGDDPLFEAPLHPSQVREIESALALWNVSYSSDAAGTQVFVPAASRREILLRLTMAGLLRPYVPTSSDIIAEPVSPITPRELVDDRRRAGIEGDLTQSLRRIAGVADASVILTPAVDDPFASGSAAPPSAAVQLQLNQNGRLDARAVDGIRRLVAAGVAGLTPDRVTVTDSDGDLLEGSSSHDQSASREARLQQSVQTAMDAVLGQGASVVRVRLITTGADVSLQSTRVTPHGLLDADVGREHGRESTRLFDKERHVQHYAYDTDIERRTTPADAVRRVSVAVILDARRVDASRRDDVAGLVRAAAGADLAAGDTVVVAMLPFASPPGAARELDAGMPAHPGAAAMMIPAGAACAVVVGVALWRRRREIAPTPPEARNKDEALELAATFEAETPRTAAYVLNGMPPALRVLVLREFDSDRRCAIEACMAQLHDV